MGTRTLRLSPRDVMTGDFLSMGSDRRKAKTWALVTWVESEGTRWTIECLNYGKSTYAVQRRLTVKRSGPKGLGE